MVEISQSTPKHDDKIVNNLKTNIYNAGFWGVDYGWDFGHISLYPTYIPLSSWELSKGITHYNDIGGERERDVVYECASHSSNIKPLK